MLEVTLAAVPEELWDDLEPLVPPLSASDSAMMARMNHPRERHQKQAPIPVTLHLGGRGGVHADTTIVAGGKPLRIVLQRLDTLSVRRPW